MMFFFVTPSFAQEDTLTDRVPEAIQALLTYSEKNDIPLSYIRHDLLVYIDQMQDKEKRNVLKMLNRNRELELEKAYHQSVQFDVKGTTAYMYGRIDGKIFSDTKKLFAEHPDLEKIVMVYIQGSIDDFTNFKAIKYIREKDIIVEIHPKGFIASGGVDFLLAGTTRNIYRGAKIGVHSRRYGGIADAIQLPKTHSMHIPRLSFYEDISMEEAYYRFVLENATADQVHWLTEDELVYFGFTDKILSPIDL